jgi:hypothetical protein
MLDRTVQALDALRPFPHRRQQLKTPQGLQGTQGPVIVGRRWRVRRRTAGLHRAQGLGMTGPDRRARFIEQA